MAAGIDPAADWLEWLSLVVIAYPGLDDLAHYSGPSGDTPVLSGQRWPRSDFSYRLRGLVVLVLIGDLTTDFTDEGQLPERWVDAECLLCLIYWGVCDVFATLFILVDVSCLLHTFHQRVVTLTFGLLNFCMRSSEQTF